MNEDQNKQREPDAATNTLGPSDVDLYFMQDAPYHIPARELTTRSHLEQQTIEVARYQAGYAAQRTGVQALRNLLNGLAQVDTLDVQVLLEAVSARADAKAQAAADKVHWRVQEQHKKEQQENRRWYEQEQKRKAEAQAARDKLRNEPVEEPGPVVFVPDELPPREADFALIDCTFEGKQSVRIGDHEVTVEQGRPAGVVYQGPWPPEDDNTMPPAGTSE